MIPGDPTYGWGVGGLPMPMEVVARDAPWRGVLGSVLLTITALASLLYLDSHFPPVALRPQTAPVKIIFRLPEPEVQVSATVEPPPPSIKPPAAPPRVEPLPPPPPKIKVQRPPEVAMHRPVPESALPPPPPAVSDRTAAAEQDQSPQTAAEFPPADRTVQLGGNETASLGPGPDLRPRSERSTEAALPERGKVALGKPAPLDPITLDPAMPRQHYRANRAEPESVEPARVASLRANAGEANLGPPPSAMDAQRFQGSTVTESLPASRPAAAVLGRASVEVIPPPPAATKPQEAPPASALPTKAVASFAYLDRLAPSDLDGKYLVSLNRLRTCRDPQAEMKLRTRLAALIRQPGTCRTGGVVFSILQPETAWSIHVDIYDFEQREFQDRCTALQLAVECLEGVRR